MPEYKYLIIGGGMTAQAAAEGIREVDPSGGIGIISAEPDPPYNRPPLSKALWKGEPLDKIWVGPAVDGLTLHLSRTAMRIDPKGKRVADDSGNEYIYGRLLIATGARVRPLPWNAEGIISFRTLEDYRRLREETVHGGEFLIIGGGFIGSELAAALAMNHNSVKMVFPEEGIGARLFPPALSRFLNSYYESKGVEIHAAAGIAGIEKRGPQFIVTMTSGRELRVDGIVAGIGVKPNQELAASAGLAVDNGILVDEFLRTTDVGIFAAGDVANFHNPALGKRVRVEHEDNAVTMGKVAGRNMAGELAPYRHLPFFYSDLFELGFEAVGELDSRYEIVQTWKEEFREGVVYYLDGGRVRGVLLWNTWGQVEGARTLIADQGPFTAEALKGRSPL